MNKPKVSICIPAYKRPELMKGCLESISKQNFTDYDVVITDDTPDESVGEVVKNFKNKIKNIKYYKNKTRRGSPENWNKCVKKAKGEYIKIIHCDDSLSDENSLSEYVKMLEENPISNFAFSSSNISDTTGKIIRTHKPNTNDLNKLNKNIGRLFMGNIIGGPSATIYRNTNLTYDRKLKWLVDIDFYMTILKDNPNFIFTERPLITTSTDTDRITNECINNKCLQFREHLYLYNKAVAGGLRITHFDYLRVFYRLLMQFEIVNISNLSICNIKFNKICLINLLILIIKLKKDLRKVIKKIVPDKIINKAQQLIVEVKWIISKRPSPPPHFIKQRIIKNYAKKFALSVFIETGTFIGDTIMSVKHIFDEIYSIEIDKSLFKKAQKRFSSYSHIQIFHGDSSKILPLILPEVDKPALFWLDGHYSEGITGKGNLNTPILEELNVITHHIITNNVILIDDARLFDGTADYPTIKVIQKYIFQKFPKYKMIVTNDIIQIYKNNE